MSDIFDVIPIDDICNKKIENINNYDTKILDNNSSDKNNKNRIYKLLIIILCYLNYVNYRKNNKILIKSKL